MGSLWSILTCCAVLVATAGAIGMSLGRTMTTDHHEPPLDPLTVQQAHDVMQSHRGCGADDCPSKGAAFRALVAAGRIVPDSRADGYSL
ncbi:hypothetical protein [Nocardia arizonensis]|uniref:hypothetical protein n=1 Tax=Nocardia arizonensis TaxID=1141647 RepID=UPI0006D25698|nr:hypothetical protein [Nocardia arizonensis]